MAKKIYDIVPPKVAHKTRHKITSAAEVAPRRRRTTRKEAPVMVAAEKTYSPPTSQNHQNHGKTFPLKEVLIGGAIIVVLLGIYFYNTLAWATVIISPKTDAVSFQENITADKSYDNVNLLKKIIPARLITQEKQVSQQFNATGSASNDGQAQGTITVYNKISPGSPLTLKTGTHFLSDGGKYFVTTSKIVVPAAKGSVAGSVSVNVQAEESGDGYNIGPSKFSVPGLSGTSYYYSIWAESKTAMSGGHTGDVKKVTADDIATAKDVLTKKMLEDAQAELKAQISPNEVLLDGAMTTNVVSASADAKEGAVQANFNETAKVTASALVFKKDDLQKFAELDAESKLADGQAVLEKSLTISYDPGTVNMQSGIVGISLKVSATSYFVVDNNALADSLVQKSADQIKAEINHQYGDNVSAVNVTFAPFWVTKAPKDKNKIKIQLKF